MDSNESIILESESNSTWKIQALIIGGVVGALIGVGGAYLLTDRMTVLQLISTAGGLTEFAKSKNILIVRTEPGGQTRTFRFNYKEVLQGKNLKQDVELKPGDRVLVP